MEGDVVPLGDNKIFFQTSKAAKDKELADYERWAFPYGEAQREKLQSLLLELFPKESVPSTLVPFLTWKELYEDALKKTQSLQRLIPGLLIVQKKYKRLLRKENMATYLAVAIADAEIDERCEYPSAEFIREQALEIDEIIKVSDNSENNQSNSLTGSKGSNLLKRIRELIGKG